MQTINAHALKHPATQDRILSGLVTANEQASTDPTGRGHVYIKNSKGSLMFRLDVIKAPGQPATVKAWRGNAQLSGVLADAFGMPLESLL